MKFSSQYTLAFAFMLAITSCAPVMAFTLVNALPYRCQITRIVECLQPSGGGDGYVCKDRKSQLDSNMPGLGSACRDRLEKPVNIAPGQWMSVPMVHGTHATTPTREHLIYCSRVMLVQGVVFVPGGSIAIEYKAPNKYTGLKGGEKTRPYYITGDPITRRYTINNHFFQ